MRKRIERKKGRARSRSVLHFQNLQKNGVVNLEVVKLREDLEKSILFGHTLIEENKALKEEVFEREQQYEIIQNQAQKKESEIKRLQLTNENLEHQMREIKGNRFVDEWERENVLSKLKEMKVLSEENEKLSKKTVDLRKKYKQKREKNEKLKIAMKELVEKVEMLEKILEDNNGTREETRLLKEKVDSLERSNLLLRNAIEEEGRDSNILINKLKVKNKRQRHEFAFKLSVIKNNLEVDIGNIQSAHGKLRKSFKTEMKKSGDCLLDVFNQLIIRMAFIQRKKEEAKVELEKLQEKEIIRIQKIEAKKTNSSFLIKWIRKFLKKTRPDFNSRRFKELSKASLQDGIVFCGLLYKFHPKKFAKFKDCTTSITDALQVFVSKFHVDDVLDKNLNPEDEIHPFVKDIYLKFKDRYDARKKELENKVNSLNDSLETINFREEIDVLVKKREQFSQRWASYKFEYSIIKSFYVSNKENFGFMCNYEIPKKLKDMTAKILQRKQSFEKKGLGSENSKVVHEFNDLSKGYNKWALSCMQKYLHPKEGADDVNEKALTEDYEDDEETLNSKEKDMTENGKKLKTIWKLHDNLPEEMDNRESLFFKKTQIETCNDIFIYSLKGIMTSQIREVKKTVLLQ